MIRAILKEEWVYGAALPCKFGFQLYRPDLYELAHPEHYEARPQGRMKKLLNQRDCRQDPSSFLKAVM